MDIMWDVLISVVSISGAIIGVQIWAIRAWHGVWRWLAAAPLLLAGADLVLHGHAHRGVGSGATPGGIPVRNVAWPVIGEAYALFRLDRPARGTSRDATAAARSR